MNYLKMIAQSKGVVLAVVVIAQDESLPSILLTKEQATRSEDQRGRETFKFLRGIFPDAKIILDVDGTGCGKIY